MVKWLLVALLAVPLADAAVLVWVGLRVGWVVTVLLVVLTALIGTLLVRAEGRRTIRKLQRSLREGTPPTDELIDGGMLIAAGALLLTPGLVTDAIGLLLVVPLSRIPLRALLKRRVIVPYVDDRTDGLATGRVYTFGFPGAEASRDVDSADFDLGGRGDAVDLDADEYDLSRTGEEDVDSEDRDPGAGQG